MTRFDPRPFSRLGVEQLEPRDVPSVTSFVTHLYQEVLDRQPDPSGYNFWVTQLNTGALSTGQVAIGFVTSAEYRTDAVVSYFRAQLGRTPTAAEAQPYVNRLAAGESQDQVRVSFFGSEEFFNDAGRDNAQFVIRLYSQILGRSPSPAEVSGWVNVLTETRGDRTFVANQFLYSPENYQYEAVVAYRNLLHRPPDAAGLAFWESQRASGMTVETMDVGFLASPEYVNRQ